MNRPAEKNILDKDTLVKSFTILRSFKEDTISRIVTAILNYFLFNLASFNVEYRKKHFSDVRGGKEQAYIILNGKIYTLSIDGNSIKVSGESVEGVNLIAEFIKSSLKELPDINEFIKGIIKEDVQKIDLHGHLALKELILHYVQYC